MSLKGPVGDVVNLNSHNKNVLSYFCTRLGMTSMFNLNGQTQTHCLEMNHYLHLSKTR